MKIKELIGPLNNTVDELEELDTLMLSKSDRKMLRDTIKLGVYLSSTLNAISGQELSVKVHLTVKGYTLLVDNLLTSLHMTYGKSIN